MQIQTIFELYIDDNKLKYSRNLKDILQSAKNNYEKMYTKQIATDATNDFFSKAPNRKKRSNRHFNLSEIEISWDEKIEHVNFENKW